MRQRGPLERLLLRPEVRLGELAGPGGPLGEEAFDRDALATVEMDIKYEGYVARDRERAARLARRDHVEVPSDLTYEALESLSMEARDQLGRVRPRTLGQAARVPGVTPADLQNLLVEIKKRSDRAARSS